MHNMDNVDHTVASFQQGFNCAQAIISVYGKQFRLNRETALKLACGFRGGMRMAETCGAVTGAFMVIGLKHGQTSPRDKQSKEKTYRLVREFADKFKPRNASVVCRELLGCDISGPRGMKAAQQKDLFNTLCPKMVRDAAEILEETLFKSG
jgi:C_GCAxxG_C_C family probable redox protein